MENNINKVTDVITNIDGKKIENSYTYIENVFQEFKNDIAEFTQRKSELTSDKFTAEEAGTCPIHKYNFILLQMQHAIFEAQRMWIDIERKTRRHNRLQTKYNNIKADLELDELLEQRRADLICNMKADIINCENLKDLSEIEHKHDTHIISDIYHKQQQKDKQLEFDPLYIKSSKQEIIIQSDEMNEHKKSVLLGKLNDNVFDEETEQLFNEYQLHKKAKLLDQLKQDEYYNQDLDLQIMESHNALRMSKVSYKAKLEEIELFRSKLQFLKTQYGDALFTKENFEKMEKAYWEERLSRQTLYEQQSRHLGVSPGQLWANQKARKKSEFNDDNNCDIPPLLMNGQITKNLVEKAEGSHIHDEINKLKSAIDYVKTKPIADMTDN